MKYFQKYFLISFSVLLVTASLVNSTYIVYCESEGSSQGTAQIVDWWNDNSTHSIVQRYVDNFLVSYNSLVKYNDVSEDYFEDYKEYFTLYCEEGSSFTVIFVKSDHNDSKNLNMIFEPIRSDNPIVIIDIDHSLNDYFPNAMIIKGYRVIVKGALLEYIDKISYVDFIVSINSDDIFNNTLIDSKNYAEYVYNSDKNEIRYVRIKEIWDPFLEENEDLFWSNINLYNLRYKIEDNLYWNESYTHDVFLNEFNILTIIVNHYKDYEIMTEKYIKLINSDDMSRALIKNNEIVQNLLLDISNNINYNENYLLSDYLDDEDELKTQVADIIKKRENFITNIFRFIGIPGFILAVVAIYNRLIKRPKPLDGELKESSAQNEQQKVSSEKPESNINNKEYDFNKILAYLFFPLRTPRKNMTLEYHATNLRLRLIINFKTTPPKVYYLTPDSVGWIFIKNNPQYWISETTSWHQESNDFSESWSKGKKYSLIPRVAEIEDLMEEEND